MCHRVRAPVAKTTVCLHLDPLMMTAPYVFPPLRNADIVLCMQELGVPFSEEDLQKPTPQRMQMAYEAFADILMGYTRETFDAHVRACQNEVDNPVCFLLAVLMDRTSIRTRSDS